MKAIHTLLRNAIDYAGLFPPAGLDMQSAVDQYAGYRSSPDAWALGRFVLPVARLSEFAAAAGPHFRSGSATQPWRLAVLSGPDLSADLGPVADFNRRYASSGAGVVLIDTLETKASSAGAIADTMHRVPGNLQVYIEIPIERDPAALLGAMAGSPARAKVRTGGVTRAAFPRSTDLIRFMAACIRVGVQFKATAGLHHPLRADYRLTYEPESERGPMFGFLNLFVAAAFLRAGIGERDAREVLEERSPSSLQVEETGIRWRSHRLTLDDLRRAREVVVSFGSCSFSEPVHELQALGLLEPRAQQA
jgi:nitroreductase